MKKDTEKNWIRLGVGYLILLFILLVTLSLVFSGCRVDIAREEDNILIYDPEDINID